MIIAAVLVLLLAGTGAFSSNESPEAPVWAILVVLISTVYGTVMAFAFPRVIHRRPDGLVSVSWAFAISPVLIAFASTFLFDLLAWVTGLTYAVSLAALIDVTRRAVNVRQQTSS